MRTPQHSSASTAALAPLACSLALALGCAVWVGSARADSSDDAPLTPTFSYTEPAPANTPRALLELTGVLTVGFLYYITTTDIVRDYNVGYSWPVFRKKLLLQAFELDTSGFNTNFIGHPIGGSLYYMTARTNHLSAAESFAIAVGGAVFWEFFGEVHEIVSVNDVLVTPLAGVGIAEPMTQLGAFFDRSGPSLRNRILASVFAPLKSLNDAFDGRTLLRSADLDRYGFPRDEWHQFDLGLGGATAFQDRPAAGMKRAVSQELRVSLASRLARLPDYDGAGHHSRFFDDANASSMRFDAAFGAQGLLDLDFDTQAAFVGHYYRDAEYDAQGELWGQGTLLGITMGYQYVLHDYDRDRYRPKDLICTVEPLGVQFEHRAALGRVRLVTRVLGGGDFGGVRPYAQRAYSVGDQSAELPVVLTKDSYYFAVGGHVVASVTASLGLFEAAAKYRYERYGEIGVPLPITDRAQNLEARASVALGDWPARVSVVAQRRTRDGRMGEARASRGESSLGVELGARY